MPSYSPGLLIGFPSHFNGDNFGVGDFIIVLRVAHVKRKLSQSKVSVLSCCAQKKFPRCKMENDLRNYLLLLARVYAKANDLALATVSRRFHGADGFLEDFAVGKCTVTLRKYDEMIDAFEKHWPDNVAFPQCKLVNKSRPANRLAKTNHV